MTLRAMQRVMPMIAEIEDDNFVAVAKLPPKWKVPIDRESVAMTQKEPRTRGTAMLTDVDDRAVLHLHVKGVAGVRHMMNWL